MKTTLLLMFQFVGPVAVGLIVTHYLRMVTLRLLVDVCGTLDRAEFWVRISSVLMVFMPLALVLVATRSPLACTADDVMCAAVIVRQTLLFTLIGSLLSVGVVACMIGQYIPGERKPAESTPAVGAA